MAHFQTSKELVTRPADPLLTEAKVMVQSAIRADYWAVSVMTYTVNCLVTCIDVIQENTQQQGDLEYSFT